jgi:E3 ubiquitin-protein ligase BRE1
MRIDWFL